MIIANWPTVCSLTRYSNGEETVVNYGDKSFIWRNSTVNPRGFKLFKQNELLFAHRSLSFNP